MGSTRYGGKQREQQFGKRTYSQREYSSTHAVFAKENNAFNNACNAANVKPTRRQASKYRRKFGAAYAAKV